MSREQGTKAETVELVATVSRNRYGSLYKWNWRVEDSLDRRRLESGSADLRLWAWWKSRRACRAIARERLGIDQTFSYRYTASYDRTGR